jgi:hypothetical protein
MRSLYNDPESGRVMGTRARSYILQHFTIDSVTHHVTNRLLNIIHDHNITGSSQLPLLEEYKKKDSWSYNDWKWTPPTPTPVPTPTITPESPDETKEILGADNTNKDDRSLPKIPKSIETTPSTSTELSSPTHVMTSPIQMDHNEVHGPRTLLPPPTQAAADALKNVIPLPLVVDLPTLAAQNEKRQSGQPLMKAFFQLMTNMCRRRVGALPTARGQLLQPNVNSIKAHRPHDDSTTIIDTSPAPSSPLTSSPAPKVIT